MYELSHNARLPLLDRANILRFESFEDIADKTIFYNYEDRKIWPPQTLNDLDNLNNKFYKIGIAGRQDFQEEFNLPDSKQNAIVLSYALQGKKSGILQPRSLQDFYYQKGLQILQPDYKKSTATNNNVNIGSKVIDFLNDNYKQQYLIDINNAIHYFENPYLLLNQQNYNQIIARIDQVLDYDNKNFTFLLSDVNHQQYIFDTNYNHNGSLIVGTKFFPKTKN